MIIYSPPVVFPVINPVRLSILLFPTRTYRYTSKPTIYIYGPQCILPLQTNIHYY